MSATRVSRKFPGKGRGGFYVIFVWSLILYIYILTTCILKLIAKSFARH